MEDGSLVTAVFSFLSFLAAGVGAYLSSYLKKRAETQATREDFNEIKQQLQETTRVAEEVRSRVWVTQERWRLKRDLYLSLLQILEEGGDIFRQVSVLIANRQESSKPDTQDLRQQYTDRFERVRVELRKARATASLVNEELANLIVELERTTNESAVSPKQRESLEFVVSAFEETYRKVVKASRNDLELPK